VAFPVVESVSQGAPASAATSHPTTFPTGATAGNLLILLFIRGNAAVTTWPAGWTVLASNPTTTSRFEIGFRRYQAGDAVPTLTTSVSTFVAWQMLRISGIEPNVAPEISAAIVAGSSTPTSALLDPAGWDVADTLWISVVGYGTVASTVTGYPAGYTSGGFLTSPSASPTLAHATRAAAVASEDPGSFTLSASRSCQTYTIAVPPVLSIQGSAAMTSGPTLTGGALLPVQAGAGLATQSVFSASGRLPGAAAVLSTLSTLTAAPFIAAGITANLTAVSTLQAAAGLPPALAQLTASSTLSAEWSYTAHGIAQLSAIAKLEAISAPPTALVAESRLIVSAALPVAGAILTSSSSLIAGTRLPAASVMLEAGSLLSAELTYLAQAATVLSTESRLITELSLLPGEAVLAAESVLAAGPRIEVAAVAALNSGSALAIVGTAVIPVTATLSTESALGTIAFTVWPGAAELTAVSILTTTPGLPGAQALLTATSQLDVSGPFLVTGGTDFVSMAAIAHLLASATAFRPPLIRPIGPVRELLRVPQYRLYAADTRTGRIGWELPFTELSWNNPLNEAGTLRATLVIENALERFHEQGARDPRQVFREVLTGPYRFSLVLAWGNQAVFAGPYLPSTNPGDRPTVDIGAGELLRMMDKRVLADLQETVQLGPTSPGGIIKGIIDKATENQAPEIWWRQGRELPITCTNPPPASGAVTRVYYWYDTVKASEALEAYSAEEDAPDYRLDPYLVTGADGLYVKWELRIGNPSLGSAQNAWIFDDSSTIITQEIDAGRMASMWFVPGSGQDEEKLIAWWINEAVINRGFPALEDVDGSHSSIADYEVLSIIGSSLLDRYIDPIDQWTVRAPADAVPSLGSYRVGDAMRLDIRKHPVIEPGVYLRRITEISGDASPWVSIASSVEA
jgi:hypothetical protein